MHIYGNVYCTDCSKHVLNCECKKDIKNVEELPEKETKEVNHEAGKGRGSKSTVTK